MEAFNVVKTHGW